MQPLPPSLQPQTDARPPQREKVTFKIDKSKIQNAYQQSLVDELERFGHDVVRARRDAKRVAHVVAKLRKFGVIVQG